ncbi:Uncharacterized conserved protein DUF1063 [Elusimicrobium minutum Pei191]|uniref:UPF0597 protein Emin_0811 n=1 Tax=Elusimicrobium minutum (strain Pei191) TaxID=445932 RepID=Y811_ELUMP|nr:L-serine ammonia-lyase, iron-sulfur-dependent, subunit alpha [Elusimicrobium minutum]B2KCX0.1 RecName: Full=UPF0597 protein Emin_0811 [Elusimicrobium minutum Pei191]ACC98366.1 Uncharacterized conserved protein DUF1063 [Elusimicrobium minutum Pei191]
MNLLKEVLKNQVYPAMGCTEPVSVALCAAYAAKELGKPVQKAVFYLDAGTFKNGLAVRIPNTSGERGNLLAGTAGLLIAKPQLKMEILKAATPSILKRAKQLIDDKKAFIKVAPCKKHFYIKVEVENGKDKASCVISDSHTTVSKLTKNGKVIFENKPSKKKEDNYKQLLGKATLKDLIALADNADNTDLKYIKKGVEMNLNACKEGKKLKKVGFFLESTVEKSILQKNLVTETKIMAARVADARMDGIAVPVMSSGESGNQGVVAILVPYNVGKKSKVKEEKILKSIAFSHLLNGYVKVYTGSLSPLCGCAIAAGVGAAGAIVYQQNGDLKKITLAINNIISDIGGMLCDGAKSGCALKVVSSVDSAIRAAYMGLNNYGITELEGFIGKTAEETIQNLGNISITGMCDVDAVIVDIMKKKVK